MLCIFYLMLFVCPAATKRNAACHGQGSFEENDEEKKERQMNNKKLKMSEPYVFMFYRVRPGNKMIQEVMSNIFKFYDFLLKRTGKKPITME